MLKRLLLAATLAASTLLTTGTFTGTAQAANPNTCASTRHVTDASAVNRQQCLERADGCTYCYSYRTGSWELQHCNG